MHFPGKKMHSLKSSTRCIHYSKEIEHSHSLFGGVRQLILSPAIVGLLDPWVGPQHLYCVDVRLVERAHLLYIYLPHQQSIGLWINTKEQLSKISSGKWPMFQILGHNRKDCLVIILGDSSGLGYGIMISSTENICNHQEHWES